jgi:taurine dioxygenase
MQHHVLSERIGALVTGIDLCEPLSAADDGALRQIMRERKLLLFRAPDLPVEAQVGLVNCFANAWDEKGDGSFHIFVSNSKEGAVLGRPDALLFHSDCSFMSSPLSVLSLYALEMPASPSPTVFANTVTAAADLPADLQTRLDEAKGLFVGGVGGYERLRSGTAPANANRVEHPIRYPDAVGGEPTLLIDELYFDRLIGWDVEESDAVRAEVHRHLFAEQNLYVHDWQVGDLIVWDNLALQHGRKRVPEDGPRTLRRVVGLDPSVTDYEHLTAKALEIEAARRN